MNLPATHLLTGEPGHVQDAQGSRYFFQATDRTGLSGWFPSRSLVIPGVNAEA